VPLRSRRLAFSLAIVTSKRQPFSCTSADCTSELRKPQCSHSKAIRMTSRKKGMRVSSRFVVPCSSQATHSDRSDMTSPAETDCVG
jgi:hypothetical protein